MAKKFHGMTPNKVEKYVSEVLNESTAETKTILEQLNWQKSALIEILDLTKQLIDQLEIKTTL